MCRLAFLILLPLLLLPASADDLHDRFDRVVNQLRSDDAAERDKGSAELEALAKDAPDLVLPLAEDKDPEVKARAHQVLERLHLLPETAAEALFRRVGERYSQAKTIQYKVSITSRNLGMRTDMKWSLNVLAKVGNLFRYEGAYTYLCTPEMQGQMTAVCDGKKLLQSFGDTTQVAKEISANGGVSVADGIIRVGIFRTMSALFGEIQLKKSDALPVTSLELEKAEQVGDRKATVLSFTVSLEAEDATYQEKLWIESETNVLLKREATRSDGTSLTEIYSDTKFDEEIPDEKFALPKEK